MKRGWSNNGRWGSDGGGIGRGSITIPSEVPSNFSAVVTPMATLTTGRHYLATEVKF